MIAQAATGSSETKMANFYDFIDIHDILFLSIVCFIINIETNINFIYNYCSLKKTQQIAKMMNKSLPAGNIILKQNNLQLREKKDDNFAFDSFDQYTFEAANTPILEFHQRTPYFAQSSIDQRSEETFSLQFLENDFVKKKATNIQKKAKMSKDPPKIPSKNRMNQIEKIIHDLSTKHNEMKLNLTKIKHQNLTQTLKVVRVSNQKEVNKKTYSPRYRIEGNMTQRYTQKLLVRSKIETARKIEKVEAEMKECTFQPSFVSKKRTQHILAKSKDEKRMKTQQVETLQKTTNLFKEFPTEEVEYLTEKKKCSTFNYKELRNIIRCEISCLKLEV